MQRLYHRHMSLFLCDRTQQLTKASLQVAPVAGRGDWRRFLMLSQDNKCQGTSLRLRFHKPLFDFRLWCHARPIWLMPLTFCPFL